MSGFKRAALFGKLNSVAFQSTEAAYNFCKMRGHTNVELAHWIHQVLQLQASDLLSIIKYFDLDMSHLARDLTQYLDKIAPGRQSMVDFSDEMLESVKQGWLLATLKYGEAQVRSGFLIAGALESPTGTRLLLSVSSEFSKIDRESLLDRYDQITEGSPETSMAAKDGSQLGPGVGTGAEGMSAAGMGKQEALAQFTKDLTDEAREGDMDPIVGRDDEIRQIVDILMRRRQNNPILTGEAGVGKTAVVEGFAQRIASGDVPPPLRNVALKALDISALQAGASMKGEFENRLKQVIEEVQSSEVPIILFVDEAHTLIGAGGAAGTGDAANILKPALARGTLRTIAATTWAEYKKHIEKDPALTRRFQVVQVDEPSEEKAILMMRGMASVMERHHRVQVLDAALEASVRLSHRYIPARQLPDKSVSLLDTACARVAISQHSVPAGVEDCRRRIEALDTELDIIGREEAVGVSSTADRRKSAEASLVIERESLGELEQRWEEEKGLVDQILELRAQLRGALQPVEGTGSKLEKAAEEAVDSADAEGVDVPVELTDEERAEKLTELEGLQGRLEEIQGDVPLILPSVDDQAVASVVADWTGIPVGRMVKNEIETVLNLAEELNKRVIGQKHGLEMIAKRVQTSRAGLDNPSKPIGVFMLAGPSGVGKTETALALAETLYGGEHNVITINMSEFQEAHTVSTLKGSPPGYVGYGEGGVLTEAVRRKPYSVVLLDEVEKAHSDVHEIFFQVFDKGVMEDGEGRRIDFKNTLILLTSNVGSDLIMNMCSDPELMPDPEGISKALREPLLKVFPAALLGRIVTIPYYPLSDQMVGQITRLQLDRIKKRIEASRKVPFAYDDKVVDLIVSRCTELESGGRMIDSILTNTLLPNISKEFLTKMVQGEEVDHVNITVKDDEFAYEF